VVRADGSPVTSFTVNGREVSDAGGAFRLEAPRSGKAKVAVKAAGLAPALVRARGVRGEVVMPDVVLGPGVTVVGEAIDAGTRAPVAGAHATLVDPGELEDALSAGGELTRLVEPAASGPSGVFVLENAPRGNMALLVQHPRYRPELRPVATSEGRAEVALHRGGTIAGTVQGSGGESVAGARVVAASRSALDAAEGRTDAAGRFQLGPLRPGRYAVLAALPAGAPALGSQSVEVAEGKAAEAAFRPRASGATVRVRVLGAARGPATGEVLLARGDVPQPASLAALLESATLLSPGRQNPAVIADVPPGAYTLFVVREVEGQEPALVRRQVQVPSSGEVVVEVQLPEIARPAASG
jgi:hypothetical protein